MLTGTSDVLRYRCGYAAQHTVYKAYYKGDLVATCNGKTELNTKLEAVGLVQEMVELESSIEVEPVNNALHSAKLTIERIKDVMRAKHVRIHLSGSYNWREDVATLAPYKGNRWSPVRVQTERTGRWAAWIDRNFDRIKHQPRPVLFPELTEYLTKYHGAKIYKRVEADDAMGINAYKAWAEGREGGIATIDKDLDMIPGEHYNFADATKGLYYVEPDVADTLFFQQMLTGDSTDNIPGLPGVGKAFGAKLLDDCKTNQEMLDIVMSLYYTYYTTGIQSEELYNARIKCAEYHARECASLVWIYRKDREQWLDHLKLIMPNVVRISEDWTWANDKLKRVA